jgi:hypothetical protein
MSRTAVEAAEAADPRLVRQRANRGGGLRVGPLRITPIRVVVALALVGSSAFIAYAVLRVRDTSQIPMLSSGFAVLGLALAAIAIGGLVGLWRAAADGRGARAFLMSIVGGVIGLAAIGCFAAAVVLALLWRSS